MICLVNNNKEKYCKQKVQNFKLGNRKEEEKVQWGEKTHKIIKKPTWTGVC